MENMIAAKEGAVAAPVTSNKPRSSMKRKISIIIFAVVIIALIVVLVLVLMHSINSRTSSGTSTTDLNLTYSIVSEDSNATILNGTNSFAQGAFASTLGLKTDKLDTEIASMKQGDTKTITLDAADAYGAYDKNNTYDFTTAEFTEAALGFPSQINRTDSINRTVTIPISTFTDSFDEQPKLDQVYTVQNQSFKVTELDNQSVTISREVKVGDEIPSYFMNIGLITKVKEVTDEKITLRIEGNDLVEPSEYGNLSVTLDEDYVHFKFTPIVGKEFEITGYPKARVIEVSSEKIVLDANNQYAGKSLIVTVMLNKITTTKSAAATGSAIVPGAPTLQVFIMSHCPYGTQILKGLLPVMEKFNGKANVELRFVNYTMHGAQEELDNKRIACIREEQSDKLIEYLSCFVSSTGQEADIQTCIAKVDKTKLDSCVESKAATYLEADNVLNEKYGVKGSPTIIIDGKEASIGRDPQSLATAVCNAFTGSKPSVCSETFDSTSPSAGFGTGASSSGGSCG